MLGSLVDRSAAERVTALVLDAIAKGARLLAGGSVNGTLINAHVLDHVTPEMRIYHEESFGPVAAVVRAKGEDEAVRIANDTLLWALGGGFGRDVNRAFRVARRLETGICHVNGPTVHDEPQMPFGGVKDFRLRPLRGKAAIHEFTELRWITTVGTEALPVLRRPRSCRHPVGLESAGERLARDGPRIDGGRGRGVDHPCAERCAVTRRDC